MKALRDEWDDARDEAITLGGPVPERPGAASPELVVDSPEWEEAQAPWEFGDKCPHCGHRAALHSCRPQGPCAGDDRECACPGWHPAYPDPSTQAKLF